MNKMAVFVEGKTEMLFVCKLLQEIAAKNHLTIHTCRLQGPLNSPRMDLLYVREANTVNTHFVMIFDCANDDLAKDRMRREYSTLTTTGQYKWIICLRDVYPKTHADLHNFELHFPRYVPTQPVQVQFILAIMEIEAWMLAEHSHFVKVSSTLTCAAIQATLGFDPSTDDMMLRSHPAEDLNRCYQLAGKVYSKGNEKQINNIDFSEVYLSVKDKFPYLHKLCGVFDTFLATPSAPTEAESSGA